MSYNNSYYHNFHGNSTFQGPQSFMPPPPLPPPYFMYPLNQATLTDIDILKQFENKISNVTKTKSKPSISISKVRDEIRNLALALKDIKTKQKILIERMNDLSEETWNSCIHEIDNNKAIISKIMSTINDLNIDVLKNLLVKRASKRARQKRQREERKKAKEEQMIRNKEKSRKIDEFVQKFQDDINKVKQEKEAKLEADAVLRETMRKKQDAKKYIVKLDALVKLRIARQNTAKGRGENVSEKEADIFKKNIEKLKAMWNQRLTMYKEEETELRAKLKKDSEDLNAKCNETEKEVVDNLQKWKEVLFGGGLPQVDFAGDLSKFVAIRSQWDQHLNSEGSSLPIGWVPPTAKM